jgi:hypothetical protein
MTSSKRSPRSVSGMTRGWLTSPPTVAMLPVLLTRVTITCGPTAFP